LGPLPSLYRLLSLIYPFRVLEILADKGSLMESGEATLTLKSVKVSREEI